jgi:hypothetical protein
VSLEERVLSLARFIAESSQRVDCHPHVADLFESLRKLITRIKINGYLTYSAFLFFKFTFKMIVRMMEGVEEWK